MFWCSQPRLKPSLQPRHRSHIDVFTKRTAECSGILQHPGWAPVIPMLPPPPLGAGCCRSYLGQQQLPPRAGASHIWQSGGANTHQRGTSVTAWPRFTQQPHFRGLASRSHVWRRVCAHNLQTSAIYFTNTPFAPLTSTDMISRCQPDNVGLTCIFPFLMCCNLWVTGPHRRCAFFLSQLASKIKAVENENPAWET